jgi:alpha-glucosidase
MSRLTVRALLGLVLLFAATAGFAQDSAQSELTLELLPGEAWWGGAVTLGRQMPFGLAPIDINLDGDNRGNQYAPLLVSSKGRYVWCEQAFRFVFSGKTLHVTSAGNTIRHGRAGGTLRDAYRHAATRFFPTDGKLPDLALFAVPQYNTWIELMYDQNQRDILKYARAIVDNGFPPGVLMIDDNWRKTTANGTSIPAGFPIPRQ